MTRIPPAPAEHPVSAWQGTAHCHEDVNAPDPCGAPPVAWRWDSRPDGQDWYPVCRKHARGRAVWPTPAQCKAAGQPYRRPTAKPQGPTRTQLRAKCDRLFAEYVRSHGQCEAKGVDGIACSERLQCAHVLSRKHLGVRWNPLNALTLCSAHHVWFTHHELHWEIWRDAYVGTGVYALLREDAIAYIGPPDYAKVLADLAALAEGRVGA